MNLSHVQKVRILYKTILRLHRGLPAELQPLGNNYARDEFKRHKKCTDTEANIFMHEWTKYALTIAQQLGLRGAPKGQLGQSLDESVLEDLRSEQIAQLYELSLAAKGGNSDGNPQASKEEVK